MRKKLYEVIEVNGGSSFWSVAYDYFMMVVIVASLLPLASRRNDLVFRSSTKSRWRFSSSIIYCAS